MGYEEENDEFDYHLAETGVDDIDLSIVVPV